MLVLDKNYMQMSMDFEQLGVIRALLVHFRELAKTEAVSPSFRQPKPA
jgi:hypothetical protein